MMSTENRSEIRVWAVVLVAVGALIGVGALLGVPLLQDLVAALEPGVGLKTASLWSFGLTTVLFIIFAIVAGDGLIGELQFMLLGFFWFFVIITLLIAWVL